MDGGDQDDVFASARNAVAELCGDPDCNALGVRVVFVARTRHGSGPCDVAGLKLMSFNSDTRHGKYCETHAKRVGDYFRARGCDVVVVPS